MFILCFGIQTLSSEPLSFEVTISPISKEYLPISESKVQDMFTWVDPSCSTIGYQLFADQSEAAIPEKIGTPLLIIDEASNLIMLS